MFAVAVGVTVLVLLAAVNSTVALYYYLQVVKAAYLLPADGRPVVHADVPYQLAGYLSMTVTLVAGIYPSMRAAKLTPVEALAG